MFTKIKYWVLGILTTLALSAGIAYVVSYNLPPVIQTGDLFVATSTTQAVRLPIGPAGYVLQSNGSVPRYVATSTLGIIGGGGITNAYASSTFPSFTYASSTYQTTLTAGANTLLTGSTISANVFAYTVGNSGADFNGSTDAAINAATSAASTTPGATIILKKGTYTQTNVINLYSNENLECDYGATILTSTSSSQSLYVNGDNRGKISDCYFHGTTPHSASLGITSYRTIELHDSHLITMDNDIVDGSNGYAVYTTSDLNGSSTDVTFIGGYYQNTSHQDVIGGGPFVQGSSTTSDVTILGTHLYNNVDNGTVGVNIDTNCVDLTGIQTLTFIGGDCYGSIGLSSEKVPDQAVSINGVTLHPNLGATSTSGDILINQKNGGIATQTPMQISLVNNILTGGGIRMEGSPTSSIINFTIANNTEHNATSTAQAGDAIPANYGFYGDYIAGGSISGNVMYAYGSTTPSGTGIYLTANTANVQVSDNYLEDYATGVNFNNVTSDLSNNNHFINVATSYSNVSSAFGLTSAGHFLIGTNDFGYQLNVLSANPSVAYFGSTGHNNANITIDDNGGAGFNGADALFDVGGVVQYTVGHNSADSFIIQASSTPAASLTLTSNGNLTLATTTISQLTLGNGLATSFLAVNPSGQVIATTSPQLAGNYLTALTGDVTASGPGSAAATLASVNSNIGSFTNANITVNAKGLITAAANGTSGGSGNSAWTIGPQNIYNATSTDAVEIGTISPFGLLTVYTSASNAHDPLAGLANSTNWPLVLENGNATNASSTGIGFSITPNLNNIGGGIVFKRTGSSSQGEMDFYTKNAGGTVAQALSLTDAQNVNIATLTPSTLTGTDANKNVISETLTNSATLSFSTGTPTSLSASVLSVPNSVTFNSGGAGGASPQVFNGSSAETISYNTIGAQVAGTYLGNTNVSGTLNQQAYFTANNTVNSSANHLWLNTAQEESINSATPYATLVVQSSSSSQTLPIFSVASSTGAPDLTVTALGNVNVATLTASSLLMSDAGNNLQSVTLGTNLSFSGSTLNASGGGSFTLTGGKNAYLTATSSSAATVNALTLCSYTVSTSTALSTNNYTTLDAALNAANAGGGGNICLTDPSYTLTTAAGYKLPSHTTISGNGAGGTIINFDGKAVPTLFKASTTAVTYVAINNIQINNTNALASTTSIGIDISNMAESTFSNVNQELVGKCYNVNDTNNVTFYDHINDNRCFDGLYGIYSSSTNPTNMNFVDNFRMAEAAATSNTKIASSSAAIYLTKAQNWDLKDIDSEPDVGTNLSAVWGIRLLPSNNGDTEDTVITNAHLEGNGTGLQINANVQRTNIIGGQFSSNTVNNVVDNGQWTYWQNVDNNFVTQTQFPNFTMIDNTSASAVTLFTNNTNFAHVSSNLVQMWLQNGSDSSNVLALNNAGTGADLIATSTSNTIADFIIKPSAKVGIGTSTPVANFQAAIPTSNATTTIELGKAGQTKGTCIKLYRGDGSAIYASVAAGATTFTLSTTACASVTGF